MGILFGASNLFAEKITQVREDGSMSLESGKIISLAGIDLPPESMPLLSILITNKEVDVQEAKKVPKISDAEPVYLYVRASELEMPFKGANPRDSRVLINRFLLEIGAATLQPGFIADKEVEFKDAEAGARKRGEGVWSYETAKTIL